ncbi:MAG: hypothetical protein ACD_81C00210G0008 [uncultured bacterium]|uniref:Uncharacterized protein n=1 Tax=Candidatus Wolfebacteria bacterium GW2011_GWC2_39_22 TaxID=1619013 RepID=A0A0G0RF55_9BACT|nr:MAG: hypothetical protein ACD_81C00210G0008 [uncultured bacterium]KKR12287.1 MAG: hypothetical protein UT41_C0002G0061 [Candidatus Wolfebacteria bacterium GW2011_GWC2_39_22]HBI25918.1 hypothetical protein [Candidatus Wolfebacteria bacterium]
MKKFVVLLAVLVFAFGLASVAAAQEEGAGPPELETANNLKKAKQAWAPLVRAQEIVVKNFPGAYPVKWAWTLGSGGYEQNFWLEQGKGREEIGVVLSFEGKVYYWVSESRLKELK